MVTAVIQGNNSAAELPEMIKGTRILLLIVADKIPLNSACQQKKKLMHSLQNTIAWQYSCGRKEG